MTAEVLIACGWGVLTAIRSTDGSVVWQVHDGTGSVSAYIMGTAVYTSDPGVPGEPGYPTNRTVTVYAHALSDGRLLWQQSMGNYPVLDAAANNTVLVVTQTAIVALRGSDGRQMWSFPHADESPFVATVVDGVVLLGYSSSRQIVALDLQRGSLYWQTML
jgi:outer membrane protein assembly factor BamB